MKKVLTIVILPIIIILLGWAIYSSINQPVKFKKEREAREKVAKERLIDIRTLQVAYKSVHAKYAPSIDSLIDFYNNGTITIVKQIGSLDDSVAVARKLVKREKVEIPVKDTILASRTNFVIDSLRTIPFSGGDPIIIKEVSKMVSGVNVPLFEAGMPYNSLLKGLDHQLIVNLNAERKDTDRYPGMLVGSITSPNNNAGNWE
ncbi:MAG: hypothetical protein PHD11_04180 [Bacteroidales bacterium]|nr:hypothetical protein [Bacteroidales bacterium]MDD4670225.1 hypothetical protein [Bacteroidales bacterium]